MTNIVVASDVHIDSGHGGRMNPTTGIHTAWESAERCLVAVVDSALSERPEAFVVAGDVFDDWHPGPEATEMFAAQMRRLTSERVPVVICFGNHEVTGLPASWRHVLNRYSDIDGVTVCSSPQLLKLDSGLQLAVVPWPRTGKSYAEAMSVVATQQEANELIAAGTMEAIEQLAGQVDPSEPAALIAHLAISAAALDSTKRGSEIEIAAMANRFGEPIIPIEAVDCDPWSISVMGHIHRRQKMGERSWYSGSLDRITVSEEGNEKGASRIRFDSSGAASMELIATPARAFHTVTVDFDADKELPNIAPGELVRVRYKGHNVVRLREIQAAIEAAGASLLRAECVDEIAPVVASDLADAQPAVDERSSVLDGLSAWMDREELNDEEVRERLSDKASALLGELEGVAG